MATFPKNHGTLYFDALIRTQKAESLLSLIQATYHAKKAAKADNVSKDEIAKRLQFAYALFKDNVKGYDNGYGSYTGSEGQFESQYTLGHEMAIWLNSALDLNPLAKKVAENKITIKNYLDIVMLNYVQPVNEICVHPLYAVLNFMKENNVRTITKEQVAEALKVPTEQGALNGLVHILLATNYFRSAERNEITYCGEQTIEKLISRCNIKYIGAEGYILAKEELDESAYNTYIISEKAKEDDIPNMEILNKNFYGMHITRRNSALSKGEISIGWSALGDLTDIDTKEKLSTLMDATFPDKKARSKAQDISQVWTFIGDMAIGDYIVFSDGKQAHIGVIKSDYYYEVNEETRDVDYVNNRKVEWLKSVDRDALPKMFRSALAATRSVFSLNAYKSIILELLEKDLLNYDEEEGEEEEIMEEQRPYIELNFTTNIECDYERNRIVFGAPGTGKSFQMEEDRKTVLATMGGGYERVTFHPDYTYSSFVGCYKPVSEKGKIEYKYVPGPFMRVLVQALRSGLKDEVAKPYLLVIEEINRAKVAAVFGEVFQLLDRDENGTSDYEINASEDVKQYLSDELGGSLESFDKIRIPNNMFIWASMNSADQGVFPMDTAFKRRWSFEYKGIDENEDKVGGKIVLGKGEYELEVDWNDLRKAINDVLARTFKINEDKLMGPFFIGEDVFAFDKETKMINNPEKFKKVFKSKVIMYLFEDAAKQHKHKLFSGCDATTYSAICNKFDEIGIDIFGADFRTTYFAK